MRIVGMDIHRSFAQAAILEDGAIIRQLRVDLVHDRLIAFAKTLNQDDEVVIDEVVIELILASIGDIARFPSPDKLSSYFGLTSRVRQSGEQPARHGQSSKQGNRDARKLLVEAA
ncbi:Transposase IS116/IS110/IS902 family protein [Bradyrhizobium brasilense]|uniref:Transposase IS116/IS110/IS902 family protein n=1 Tax=Bradyrhizobium brasilense TaxID=1419277 RepID=A0A1G6U6B2_9BRAD|nr:transposase [Bradyrhizobium brasilense]SDD36920.1 Transposase IS116/IS110/IS902 family protein [Bradyrhizobium brasilense]